MRALLMSAVVLSFARSAAADTYAVGPGAEYESIADVPWEDLGPGDIVEINARATAYKEKIVLGGRGAGGNPITVRGVPDGAGRLPVLDGANATTREVGESWNEERGVIKIGGTDVPLGPPQHIVIEKLEVKGAKPGTAFRDSLGQTLRYEENAAALFVEEGAHVTIRDCAFKDSANGIFVAPLASDVLVEGNDFSGNGVVGSFTNHHAYTESKNIVFDHNHFGSLLAGSNGNAIEDRSITPVIRYNWIEGGFKQIALFESDVFSDDPGFGLAFVYGNVLIENAGDGDDVMVAWGGGNDLLATYRKGTMYFHHNTLYSKRTDKTTLFDTPTATVDARNNILYTSGAGNTLAIATTRGTVGLHANWLSDGYIDSHEAAFTGTITEDGTIGGMAPGFADPTGADVRLADGSDCIDKAGPLASEVPADHQPILEYLNPRATEARPSVGVPDLGAYENANGADTGGDDVGPTPDPDPDPPDPETPPPMASGGGCGCHVGAKTPVHATWPLVPLGLGVLLVARRRRSR